MFLRVGVLKCILCPQPPRPLDRLSSVHLMGVWGLRERAFSFISVEPEPRGPPAAAFSLAWPSSPTPPHLLSKAPLTLTLTCLELLLRATLAR